MSHVGLATRIRRWAACHRALSTCVVERTELASSSVYVDCFPFLSGSTIDSTGMVLIIVEM